MSLQPNIKRFEEVKRGLIEAISTGMFKPGDRLPSLRDLSTHFKVSLATIQRAIQELKDEEWLNSEPWKGISVADPLPPVAHLMQVKNTARDNASINRPAHDSIGTGRNGTLRCLIYDEALLPLFEWAAQEYSEAYAPYSMRFEFQPSVGHDDEESVRALDADLALLPSHAVNRAVRFGTITPSTGMLRAPDTRFTEIAPGLMDLVTYQATLWAAPLMASGAILVAHDERCRRFGIDPATLTSVDALIKAMEGAVSANGSVTTPSLFNMTFVLVLLILAGHPLPPLADVPALLTDPGVRALLERLRALAGHASIAPTRFDQWRRIDLSALAVRHQPSGLFCHDPANRDGARVLPVLQDDRGTAPLAAHCLCIGAHTLHPYEAWEWAAHLADKPFQRRLAELGYDIPASLHPEVAAAFSKTVGADNARTLLDMIRRSSRLYGIGPQDTLRYLWEVLSNELYRFVTGMNDYAQMRERVATKTARFLALDGSQQGG